MTSPCLPPGFRFFPTDEELIVHYLSKRASSLPLPVSIIAEVDIYKFDPWDLPAKAVFGDREWYFFTPRDRKYPNGARPNRAAISGYWKATGTDKQILTNTNKKNIGVKKALVFYKGKPPKGQKTCWIMHEYRLTDSQTQQHKLKYVKPKESSMRLDDWVLCRIYKKNSVNHSTPPVAPQLGLGLDKDQEETSTVEDFYSSGLVNVDKPFSLSDLLNDAEYSNLSQFLTMEQHDIPGPKRIKPAHGFMQDGAGFLPSSSKKINSSFMPNLSYFNQL